MPYTDPQRHLPANTILRGYRLPSLYWWRNKRGLTLAELAAKAHVSVATIAKFEHYPAVAKYKTIYKLAAALEVSPLVLTLDAPYTPAARRDSAPYPTPKPKPTDKAAVAKLADAYRQAIARIEQLERTPRQAAPTPEALADGKIISFTARALARRGAGGPYKQPW